jgi:hypothetical protein
MTASQAALDPGRDVAARANAIRQLVALGMARRWDGKGTGAINGDVTG